MTTTRNVVLFLMVFLLFACKTAKVKYPCGRFWDTKDEILADEYTMAMVQFVNISPFEKVADIGAGAMQWEGVFSVFTDNIQFYSEDISTECTNFFQANKVLSHYARLSGKAITSSIKPVLGTISHTHLPDSTFDKVLVVNTFHEFSHRTQMLDELKRIMKKGGLLFIEERLPTSKTKVHQGCQMPLLSEEEMLEIMAEVGLKLISKKKLPSPVADQIYCFQK